MFDVSFFPMPSRCLRWGLIALALWLGGADFAAAEVRFSISADGQEVSDSQTGLIWRRYPEPGHYTWQQALQWAAAQGGGWRLPNVKELQSLVDYGVPYPGPTIDAAAFPNTPAEAFWSSSPCAASASLAWIVYFSYGGVDDYLRYDSLAVRLVRAGQ